MVIFLFKMVIFHSYVSNVTGHQTVETTGWDVVSNVSARCLPGL